MITPNMKNYILENYEKMSDTQLAEALDISKENARWHRRNMKLTRTPEQHWALQGKAVLCKKNKKKKAVL